MVIRARLVRDDFMTNSNAARRSSSFIVTTAISPAVIQKFLWPLGSLLTLFLPPWLPEVLKISKRQSITVLGDVVGDIYDQTPVLAAVLGAAQSAAHHLLI